MNPVAKILVIAGVVLILSGVFWQFGSKVLPLGRLPGDIAIQREGFSFYFPVVTCVLISVLLTLGSWIFRWINK